VAVVSTAAADVCAQEGSGPIRTCIGCRTKAPADELFRVVAARTPSGTVSGQPDQGTDPVLVVPDPGKRAPGRGAWLHPTIACAEQAQRRRAYARALRVPGACDAAPVMRYVAEQTG